MISGIGQNNWWIQEQRNVGQTGAQAKSAGNPFNQAADRADISDTAMQMLAESQTLTLAAPDGWNAGQSTAGQFAGVSNKGLKKYLGLNGAYTDTSIGAMNMSRKSIGSRIEQILKGKGIKLGKDEKLAISVDAKNNIVVGGVKDKAKLEAITQALNDDKKLAKDMRSHVATGKINDSIRKQAAYEKQMAEMGVAVTADKESGGMGQDMDDMFTDRGVRTYLIDEYLQNQVGVSIADLDYEYDEDGNVSIIGMPAELRQLLEDDPDLAKTVGNMLENGETVSDFKVAFEYANGAISDSTSNNASKEKFESIKTMLMGGVDPYTGEKHYGMLNDLRESLETDVKGINDDEDYQALMRFLSRGFSIQVGADGQFDIVGADKLEKGQEDILKNLVNKALNLWASKEYAALDPAWNPETDHRTASLADLADSFIEQHRFEHGDVDEYAHMAKIDFTGSFLDIKVVSPEADKAQDEKNQKNADELGKQLKTMLEEEGVDVGDGLEVEVDENGKFTVIGDADDPNIKKAQQILDQFAAEGKASNKEDSEEERKEKEEATRSRREARGADAYTRFSRKAFLEETLAEIEPHLPTGETPSLDNYRMINRYMGWKTVMDKSAYGGGTVNNSTVGPVSDITAPRYAEGGAAPSSLSTLAMNEENYADDARGLYRKLLDGMGQFHDADKKPKYRFMIQ